MTASPETYRAVLTPAEISVALGHFVLFMRGGPTDGHANTQCLFVFDETKSPAELRQVRVEVTVTEEK
jgi:hypothetical protein